MPTRIDPYSLAIVPVEQFFRDQPLGHATAFMWERREKKYLITNWHVVTGRNHETGVCLAAHGGEPDRLRAWFRGPNDRVHAQSIDIRLRDGNSDPVWFIHASHGRDIDVVAIPLSLPSEIQPVPLNKLRKENLSIQVGMDVFVLGYPFAPKAPFLPVWKRGSLASEPELVRLADQYYLVDTASRPGMSGSPVILRAYAARLTESGTSIKDEPGTRFLGVYSGRLATTSSDDAQLGRVWPESSLVEIIDGAKFDSRRNLS